MKQQLEIEFKTLVSKEQFENITKLYGPLNFLKQHNYYYKSSFSSQSFRIRITKEKKIFTLKEIVDEQILEHEKEFTGLFYEDKDIKTLLDKLEIYPPFNLEGELITYRAIVETDLAQLCFDFNHYNNLIDYEIEYELKKDHDGLSSFKRILSQADIIYKPTYASKYVRCLNTLKE